MQIRKLVSIRKRVWAWLKWRANGAAQETSQTESGSKIEPVGSFEKLLVTSDRGWFVLGDGDPQGPFDDSDLLRLHTRGSITRTTRLVLTTPFGELMWQSSDSLYDETGKIDKRSEPPPVGPQLSSTVLSTSTDASRLSSLAFGQQPLTTPKKSGQAQVSKALDSIQLLQEQEAKEAIDIPSKSGRGKKLYRIAWRCMCFTAWKRSSFQRCAADINSAYWLRNCFTAWKQSHLFDVVRPTSMPVSNAKEKVLARSMPMSASNAKGDLEQPSMTASASASLAGKDKSSLQNVSSSKKFKPVVKKSGLARLRAKK